MGQLAEDQRYREFVNRVNGMGVEALPSGKVGDLLGVHGDTAVRWIKELELPMQRLKKTGKYRIPKATVLALYKAVTGAN